MGPPSCAIAVVGGCRGCDQACRAPAPTAHPGPAPPVPLPQSPPSPHRPVPRLPLPQPSPSPLPQASPSPRPPIHFPLFSHHLPARRPNSSLLPYPPVQHCAVELADLLSTHFVLVAAPWKTKLSLASNPEPSTNTRLTPGIGPVGQMGVALHS